MSTNQTMKTMELFKDLKTVPKFTETKFTDGIKLAAEKTITFQKENIKKRTFEINEDVWQDFAMLVKADDKTINEYINELVAKEVASNQEFLGQLKNRKKI